MPGDPLVTVGILSYNRPLELREAVASVIAQSYRNLEILISDNGSTNPEMPAALAALAASDSRIRIVRHPENRGPLFNFAFLVGEAAGRYFSWLADDDAYSPTAIADCVTVLESAPQVVLAANIPVVAGTNAPVPLQTIPDTRGLEPAARYRLTIDYLFEGINLFYYGLIRRDALLNCRFYLKRLYGSDQLLLPELLSFGDIAINRAAPGYIYTVHEAQTSGNPLRYRRITLQGAGDFIERRFFFNAYIGFLIRIIRSAPGLSATDRRSLSRHVLRRYIGSRRFHMLKYDLGLNGIIAGIKRLSGRAK